MTGSEQAKAKEDAAAIMRAKQVAGMFLLFPFSRFPRFLVKSAGAPSALWKRAMLISRAAEQKKLAEGKK
jgi:hypothetical protein